MTATRDRLIKAGLRSSEADALLDGDRDLAADLEFGAALRDLEVGAGRWDWRFYNLTQHDSGKWEAQASKRRPEGNWDFLDGGDEPTPTAALLVLAEKLREAA